MATGTPIDPVIKSEILQRVREEGLSVYKAAQIYNVNYRTTYGWIKKQIDGKDRNLILENNRLKKELDTAYRIIGRLTAELRRYYIYRKADLPRAGYSFSRLTGDRLKIWVEGFAYVPFRGKFY